MQNKNVWIVTVTVLVMAILGLVFWAITLDSDRTDLEDERVALEQENERLNQQARARQSSLNELQALVIESSDPDGAFPGVQFLRTLYLEPSGEKLGQILKDRPKLEYSTFVSLYKEVYDVVKGESPDTQITVSFSGTT